MAKEKPKLTARRIATAFAIAIFADLIQLPITAATATGIFSIPAELADLVVDGIVMFAITAQLGFHWVFLPSLVVEVIPGVDLIPTWTASVAYVVWQRRKERKAVLPERSVIDV